MPLQFLLSKNGSPPFVPSLPPPPPQSVMYPQLPNPPSYKKSLCKDLSSTLGGRFIKYQNMHSLSWKEDSREKYMRKNMSVYSYASFSLITFSLFGRCFLKKLPSNAPLTNECFVFIVLAFHVG